MKGPFSVILELPGKEPELVCTCRSEIQAGEIVMAVAKHYGHVKGTRVSLRTPNSGDQLQLTQKGQALRDQPKERAVGENIVIAVPTALVHLGSKEPSRE